MRKRVILFCGLALLLAALPALACTGIRMKTQDGLVFYARTMEFAYDTAPGVMLIPKGTKMRGTLPDGTQKGLAWTAKYGVAGLNSQGGPFIIDGLNDAGLAGGGFLFPGYSKYQPYSSLSAGSTICHGDVLNWALSNFASVEELKRGIVKIKVVHGPEIPQMGDVLLHFSFHDSTGASVVVEYVDGKLHLYDNPIGVLTNAPDFPWMMTYLSNYNDISPVNVPQRDLSGVTINQTGQGSGMVGLPGDFTPPNRFVRMVALTQSAAPVNGAEAGLNQAMGIINNVNIPKGAIRQKTDKGVDLDLTQWTAVSDLGRKRLYFRTVDNMNWRYVDLAKALGAAKGISQTPLAGPANYPEMATK